MKRYIKCNESSNSTEEILDKILQILEDDYYWGGEGLDTVNYELNGSDTITEKSLLSAMNTTAEYEGLDSDELSEAFEINKKTAHEIAARLNL